MSKSPLLYKPGFISAPQRLQILEELQQLFPIWEQRFSRSRPPPPGQTQRQLLRPVYWLGNWQFACLDYYHPPKGIEHRCVQAEPYPKMLAQIVRQIEELIHREVPEKDIPRNWELNTCLINYYGSRIDGDKIEDTARVGEHKDFEPGPVASLSLGERALFQFVESRSKSDQSHVVFQQWLEDSSLQVFAGDRWKKKLFHRVQRVEKNKGLNFELNTPQFLTRRVNFTFRYVPREHIQPLSKLPKNLREDIKVYTDQLASSSQFWKDLC